MSASNDELLLFNAAKSGDLTKLKELLSKGVATGYRDEVSYIIISCYPSYIYNSVVDDDHDDDDAYVCC